MVIQTILVGILYWLSMGRASYFISFTSRKLIILGVFIGLVYEDVQTGLLYGATIQLVCMGGIETGGNISSDQGLVACITIPAVIADNLDLATTVTLVVPFGVPGILINNVRRTINPFCNTKAGKFVKDKQYGELPVLSFVLPWLTSGVLYFIPVFIAALFDSSVIQAFISVIPGWATNGLISAGNMFPGLGFALTLIVMGKRRYLSLFILRLFLYPVMGFSMLTGVVIALCLALIVSLFKQSGKEEVARVKQ